MMTMKDITMRIAAFLLAGAMTLCFSASVSAQNEASGYTSVLDDQPDLLSSEDEELLLETIAETAEKAHYSICFVFSDYDEMGTDPTSFADGYMVEQYGGEPSGLIVVVSPKFGKVCIRAAGETAELYQRDVKADVFDTMKDFLKTGDYYTSVLAGCYIVQYFSENGYRYSPNRPDKSEFAFKSVSAQTEAEEEAPAEEEEEESSGGTQSVSAAANTSVHKQGSGMWKETVSGNIALLHDLDDTLSESEEKEVFERLRAVAQGRGFSVCILISGDVGSKKDKRSVVDYADVYYEKECGINTDGILLLVNNDTQYDWISTSGKCEKIFYDAKIDRVFDYFYSYLENGDAYRAVCGFCEAVDKYAVTEVYGKSSGKTSYVDEDIDFSAVFIFLMIAAIAEFVFIAAATGGYKPKPVKGAGDYMVKSSLVFTQNEDRFIRTYVTHHTVSSSSSGGHHSSGHHSSGGGHHGGGGRSR